ncbi:MAG: (d)CMP kinase [Steroidobacteraceae bacterium]
MAGVPVLTIDGPSGSGKGTITRQIATRLGWHLLDSGALYRLVALAGQRQGLSPEDREGHARLALSLPIRFGMDGAGNEQIWMGEPGADVTAAIRSETAGQGASRVAVWPEVRSALLDRQRGFAQPPGLVADGRDMGTVVFPQAGLKIYLTASAEERALRRYNQLKDKDSGVSLAALSREIAERDRRDTTRPVAPLVPARDAVILDTTGMPIEAVVARVLAELQGRGTSM